MPLKPYRQHLLKAKKYYKEQGYISIAFIQRKYQLNYDISKIIYEKVISSSLHQPKDSDGTDKPNTSHKPNLSKYRAPPPKPFCLDRPQTIREKKGIRSDRVYKSYGPPNKRG